MVSTSSRSQHGTILRTDPIKTAPVYLLMLALAWSFIQNLWGLATQSGFFDPSLLGQGIFASVFLMHLALLALDAAALWFFFQPRPVGYKLALTRMGLVVLLVFMTVFYSHPTIPPTTLLTFFSWLLTSEQRSILLAAPFLRAILLGMNLMWTFFLTLLLLGAREYFMRNNEVARVREAAGTPFDRVLRQAAEQNAREAPFSTRVMKPWVDRLTDQSSALMQGVDIDATRIRLMRAGFPMGLRANTFVLLRYLSLIFGVCMFILVMPTLLRLANISVGPFLVLLSALIGALYGYKVPDIWLNLKTNQRKSDIQLALPDTMDLLTVSVEAGLGLYAAMQRVASRFKTPLSEEILRALQEVRLGRTHAEAMRELAQRVDVDDLSAFVSALVQAETMGIPIANVLRAQSERLREIRAQRAREQAQKAPLKLIFPLVLFIFPALFVVILGPAFLRIQAAL